MVPFVSTSPLMLKAFVVNECLGENVCYHLKIEFLKTFDIKDFVKVIG